MQVELLSHISPQLLVSVVICFSESCHIQLDHTNGCYFRHHTQSFSKADAVDVLEGESHISFAFCFKGVSGRLDNLAQRVFDVVKAKTFYQSQLLFCLLLMSALLLLSSARLFGIYFLWFELPLPGGGGV